MSMVCFLLFFWSQFLNGTAGWLEALLFIAGAFCLALEIFVMPGVGIFGFGGGALMLASLVLASQTFVLPSLDNEYQLGKFQDSLFTVGGALVGLVRRRGAAAPISAQGADSRTHDARTALGRGTRAAPSPRDDGRSVVSGRPARPGRPPG